MYPGPCPAWGTEIQEVTGGGGQSGNMGLQAFRFCAGSQPSENLMSRGTAILGIPQAQ